MELVAGQLNATYIEYSVIRNHIDECSEVIAIVAYCDSTNLFEICKEAGKRVTFYGRLDHTVPVSSNVLDWFLKTRNSNFNCLLFRGGLHAKVIWLKGEGVYIGSANLTNNGWVGNIEAGVFIRESDFSEKFLDHLCRLVDTVYEKSVSLTDEILALVVGLEKRQATARAEDKKSSDWFENNCNVPKVPPQNSVPTHGATSERRKNNFLTEWGSTLQRLRDISVRLKEYRPSWVSENVPDGVHVDQFLHAFYYNEVREGNSQPFDVWFIRNQNDPEAALQNWMRWWKEGDYPHSDESVFMHEWAPSTRQMLSKESLLFLTEAEFIKLVHQVHAMRDHATKLENELLNLSSGNHARTEKMDAYGRWLYAQRSSAQKSPLETIHYVLYAGDRTKLPERLWEATTNPEWKIGHLGMSSLGELVGWALPEIFPPRNSRTSKALRALGNNVTVY